MLAFPDFSTAAEIGYCAIGTKGPTGENSSPYIVDESIRDEEGLPTALLS